MQSQDAVPTQPSVAGHGGQRPGTGGEVMACVDGSRHADRALAWALREARLRGAPLRVLHAYRERDPARPFARDQRGDERHAAALADAEEALARVAPAAPADGLDVEVTAVAGRSPADTILRHSGAADLIVVGSRGRGGFPGLRLGAVSQQVAAHAQVPVAVVPRLGDAPAASADDAARAVVVGVDGSETSLLALRWALDEGRLRDVPVTAVYVYRSLRTAAPFDAFVSLEQAQVDELERQAAETARAKLDALLAGVAGGGEGERQRAGGRGGGLAADGVRLDRRVLAGSPARALIDHAGEHDLLVLGARGHGGFAGLLLGSVSQQCLHHARGPVVVTPVPA